MRVVLLGTGTAVPFEKRSQSSVMVESDDGKILIDAGIGTFLRLSQLEVNLSEIDSILLTHNHLDHNGDVLAILKARWLEGCREKMKIFGPSGTSNHFEALLEAFPYLRKKLDFEITEMNSTIEIAGLTIKEIPTIHSIKSQGYLIQSGRSRLLVSGDTRSFKELIETDCDILIHELSLPFGYESEDHTTPENLKSLLEYSSAKKIILTHLYPPALKQRDEILRYLEAERYNIHIGTDFAEFEL
jgi:ribonuclease BN (tRNA processing enzyme)